MFYYGFFFNVLNQGGISINLANAVLVLNMQFHSTYSLGSVATHFTRNQRFCDYRYFSWSFNRFFICRSIIFGCQKLLSSQGIPLHGGRAELPDLLDRDMTRYFFLGVQGKRECLTNLQSKCKSLALAGQCLAESHALGCHGGILTHNWCSHFRFSSEIQVILFSGLLSTEIMLLLQASNWQKAGAAGEGDKW